MELIKPCRKYVQSYYEACVESKGHLHEDYIMHDPDTYDEWKDTIIQTYEDHENGRNLPEGFVPSATRWIVEGDRYIATVNLRLYLNDALKNYGGSFGIVVRYSERGKGWATKIYQKYAKRAARFYKGEPISVMYEESNKASGALLHKLPLCREERAMVMIRGELTPLIRVWVDSQKILADDRFEDA